MTVIRVPKPPQSALNKDRPISSLLKNQIKHLQEAEFRLPARAQTNTYINAIKTEGEAADYIRQVTANLHAEHEVQPAGLTSAKKPKPGKRLTIAAMAKTKSARTESKRTASSRRKKSRS